MNGRQCWIWAILAPLALTGAEYRVSSGSQLNALQLQPGDTVVWTDGQYSGQTLNLLRDGTAEAPIRVRAETPGGVVFTGDTQINIGAAYNIVEGFYFNGSLGSTGVVEFRKSGSSTQFGRHSVLRDCAFNDLQTAGDTKSRWVLLYGERNTVERCSFLNKNSTGECVLVELSYQGTTPAQHVIRGNYFYKFSRKDGRTNDGDSEVIRVGESSYQTIDAGCVVENNYFVETDGENEIISNKSRNNRYLRNTFRRSRGALVLRHGSGAWVEGNWFLGEGAADSGGVRITDQDHVIINNYMDGLRGTSYNAAITWMGGDTASGGTSNGYQYVSNVLVAFNSIRDASESIHLNNLKGNRAPVTSTMANNIVTGTRGELITGDENLSLAGVSFVTSIFHGSPVGYTSSGILIVDPGLSFANGLWRPSPTGSAANAAAGDYPQVVTDVEGRGRPASGKDIGALEVSGSVSGALYRPRNDSEVGLLVGACFLDHLGNTIPCSDGTWAGYPIVAADPGARLVDTGSFLNWIYVSGDWIYSIILDGWIYMPEQHAGPGGGWGYFIRK